MADVQVGRLSRGQQQRVAIARALVHDPPVLLLDEPDTGLDVAALAPLEELTTAGGRTVVLTTHNLSTGLRLGTRVAVLSRGRRAEPRTLVRPRTRSAHTGRPAARADGPLGAVSRQGHRQPGVHAAGRGHRATRVYRAVQPGGRPAAARPGARPGHAGVGGRW